MIAEYCREKPCPVGGKICSSRFKKSSILLFVISPARLEDPWRQNQPRIFPATARSKDVFRGISKKLTDEQVQRLKGKYENELKNMTIEEPFLSKVASKVKHLDEWGGHSNLVVAYRLDVNRRLRDVEKLISMYELGKVEPLNVWERYSTLIPEDLEDLAQSLNITDILSRIYALRGRLVEIDQKKNLPPAKHVPMRTWRLKIVSSIEGNTEGSEFEKAK